MLFRRTLATAPQAELSGQRAAQIATRFASAGPLGADRHRDQIKQDRQRAWQHHRFHRTAPHRRFTFDPSSLKRREAAEAAEDLRKRDLEPGGLVASPDGRTGLVFSAPVAKRLQMLEEQARDAEASRHAAMPDHQQHGAGVSGDVLGEMLSEDAAVASAQDDEEAQRNVEMAGAIAEHLFNLVMKASCPNATTGTANGVRVLPTERADALVGATQLAAQLAEMVTSPSVDPGVLAIAARVALLVRTVGRSDDTEMAAIQEAFDSISKAAMNFELRKSLSGTDLLAALLSRGVHLKTVTHLMKTVDDALNRMCHGPEEAEEDVPLPGVEELVLLAEAIHTGLENVAPPGHCGEAAARVAGQLSRVGKQIRLELEDSLKVSDRPLQGLMPEIQSAAAASSTSQVSSIRSRRAALPRLKPHHKRAHAATSKAHREHLRQEAARASAAREQQDGEKPPPRNAYTTEEIDSADAGGIRTPPASVTEQQIRCFIHAVSVVLNTVRESWHTGADALSAASSALRVLAVSPNYFLHLPTIVSFGKALVECPGVDAEMLHAYSLLLTRAAAHTPEAANPAVDPVAVLSILAHPAQFSVLAATPSDSADEASLARVTSTRHGSIFRAIDTMLAAKVQTVSGNDVVGRVVELLSCGAYGGSISLRLWRNVAEATLSSSEASPAAAAATILLRPRVAAQGSVVELDELDRRLFAELAAMNAGENEAASDPAMLVGAVAEGYPSVVSNEVVQNRWTLAAEWLTLRMMPQE